MANFEVTMPMLWELRLCNNDKSPLSNFVPEFVEWAKSKGDWWWIKEGARECLKVKIVTYWGGINHRKKKEEYAIQEIPFKEYSISNSKSKSGKLPKGDYNLFRDLLIKEWLEFINYREDIKGIINKNYDNVTDPRF